jgi:hypothetical protein
MLWGPHMGILNERRRRVYPWLLLVALWSVFALNVALHHGWRGGLGQIVGIDFVVFYTGGLFSARDPAHLYDFATQLDAQRRLLAPTALAGSGPFSNPPFAAPVFGLFSRIPLFWAFVLWSAIQLLCVALAIELAVRFLVPEERRKAGFERLRLAVLVLSSYPWIEGFAAGQLHGLVLLAVTAVSIASLRRRDAVAGICAATLLFKPQFAVGFLAIWLVGRRWRALAAFAAGAAAWVLATLPSVGTGAYIGYLHTLPQLLRLPYTPGWPRALMTTPYGLLAAALPPVEAQTAATAIGVFSVLLLVWLALKAREPHVLAAAVVLPFLATPYALCHDLVVLAPALLLLDRAAIERPALETLAEFCYAAPLVLAIAGIATHLALPALVPIAAGACIFKWRAG